MQIEKAIHMLKSYAGMTHKLTDNQGRPKLDQAIDTVLNELEKAEKVIDAMAQAIINYDDQLVINRYRNKEEVKEVFEQYVEWKTKQESED